MDASQSATRSRILSVPISFLERYMIIHGSCSVLEFCLRPQVRLRITSSRPSPSPMAFACRSHTFIWAFPRSRTAAKPKLKKPIHKGSKCSARTRKRERPAAQCNKQERTFGFRAGTPRISHLLFHLPSSVMCCPETSGTVSCIGRTVDGVVSKR